MTDTRQQPCDHECQIPGLHGGCLCWKCGSHYDQYLHPALPELLEKAQPPQCSGPFGDARDCPVHAKDVRGAQPEPDELQFKLEHSQAQTRSANALIDKIQKIVGDFFGENERWSEFDVLDQGVRKIAEQARAGSSPALSPERNIIKLTGFVVFHSGLVQFVSTSKSKAEEWARYNLPADSPEIGILETTFVAGVTGNEGKDEAQRDAEGRSSVIGTGDLRDNRTSAAPLASPAAPSTTTGEISDKTIQLVGNKGKVDVDEASPAVVTPEQLSGLRYIAESPAQEHGGFHPQAIKTAKDAITLIEELASKISGLEAQLQQALGEKTEMAICTDTWKKRTQTALAELERMRAGGKS